MGTAKNFKKSNDARLSLGNALQRIQHWRNLSMAIKDNFLREVKIGDNVELMIGSKEMEGQIVAQSSPKFGVNLKMLLSLGRKCIVSRHIGYTSV